MARTSTDAARHALGERFGDRLILPGQPGYDDARRVFNGMIDRRPRRSPVARRPPTSPPLCASARMKAC